MCFRTDPVPFPAFIFTAFWLLLPCYRRSTLPLPGCSCPVSGFHHHRLPAAPVPFLLLHFTAYRLILSCYVRTTSSSPDHRRLCARFLLTDHHPSFRVYRVFVSPMWCFVFCKLSITAMGLSISLFVCLCLLLYSVRP